MNRIVNLVQILILVLSAGFFSTSAEEATIPADESGELYLASDDAMADLAATIETARESNKLALVVMGANWCHDSRALAARLAQEPLRTLVNENYATIFVDVGYLDKGKAVINSIGPLVYYATPTVLIIDPVSGLLVNANNRHQWAEAYNISMEESLDYFQQIANTDLAVLRVENDASGNIDGELQALFTEIDAFEQQQADRLYRAYTVLGPMLKAFKSGDKEAFSEDYWSQVRDFRYKVPADITTLRAQARQQVALGESEIRLDYPQYPAFSWEVQE